MDLNQCMFWRMNLLPLSQILEKDYLNSVAGVYLCINLINGKCYVGSATKTLCIGVIVHIYI